MESNYEYDAMEKLSNWLLDKFEDINLIASNVPYLKAKRLADLVVIKKNQLMVYEIKTARDDMRKINSQIEDYKTTFEYIYLVLDKKFENKISDISDEKVGIIFFNGNKFKIFRKAKKNITNTLYQALLISNDDLKNLNIKTKNLHEKYAYISKKLSKAQVKNLIINGLQKAYEQGFEAFKKEKEFNLLVNRSRIKI